MNAVRSCYAAAVPLLTILGWHAIAAAAALSVCCTGSGSGGSACPKTGNRTFHRVEAVGGTPCNDGTADAATPVHKCCPPERTYDPDERVCRPAAPNAAFRERLLSLTGFRHSTAVGYSYEPPKCRGDSVLVDVSVDDAVGRLARDDDGGDAMSTPANRTAAVPDYCLDLNWTSSAVGEPELVARACRPRKLHCRGRYTCANKCCMVGKIMVGGKCSKSETPFRSPVHEFDGGGALVPSNNTLLPYYERLKCADRDKLNGTAFRLIADGSLYRSDTGESVAAIGYCLEIVAAADGQTRLEAYVCPAFEYRKTVEDTAGSWKYVVMTAGFVPSIVCLVVTLIVYAMLSSLRNVHGYYVMSYVACLLVSFVCLLVVQWMSDVVNYGLCQLFGYLTLFAFLTTFCWLNVICFDIYWMLKYNNSINRSSSISIRTILYNIYCWGFSSICVTTGLLFQHSKKTALQKFAPNIGNSSCWFTTTDYGTIIFFLLPVSTMLLANLILFVLTAVHCSRIKSELNKFKRSDSKKQRFRVEKEKFAMSIKLFLVMGIPWTFEILSKIYNNDWFVWYILDEINALQGVMIFIIFVAKRKVISNLRKKFNRTLDHSESTKVNTISGSSYSGSARKNFNDF